VKFLIAGLGSIGRRHLKNLIALGEEDIVLFRTGESTLPDDELAQFPTESSLEKALAHKPDAVIVSNPTAMHLDVAIPAAKMGCHLLIEKPISHLMDRVSELRKATRIGGGKVLVGFQFRFHPGLRSIKRWIESGAIGKPISAHAHWGEYLPGWHPWEEYQTSYAARAELGGGVVLTLCHPFDYLRWFFGEVQWVYGSVHQLGPWEMTVEDSADAFLSFASEMQCVVHLDYVQRPPEHTLRIIGTEGTIHWDSADGIARFFQPAFKDWQVEPMPLEFERNQLFLEEMRHFLGICRDGEIAICDLDDGIEALRIALAVKESSRSGERISTSRKA
jgi:predicted dehydrogenase